MKLNDTKTERRLNGAFDNFSLHALNWENKNAVCVLKGQKAVGKTHAVHSFLQKHQNSLYFSFEGLTAQKAILLFCKIANEKFGLSVAATDWKSAFSEISFFLKGKLPILVFDCLDFFVGRKEFLEQLSAFFALKESPWMFIVFPMQISKCLLESDLHVYTIYMKYRKIAEVAKTFPTLSNKEILRLYIITGGIPCLLKMYDERLSFEQNYYNFINADSFYYKFMQMILKDHFRAPETYNELLHSISSSSHRISEIGTATGYPYNKCDKYLGALREIGIVRCDENIGYIIPNLYVRFWYKELYGKLQNTPPDKLPEFTDSLLSRLDAEYTLPCYLDACQRFWEEKNSLNGISHERIKIKLKSGEPFIFDLACKYKDKVYLGKIMDDFNVRCDKDYYQKVIDAAEAVYSFYDIELTIFSLNRFSDYCVHAVTKDTNVKLVPIVQLKY